MNFDWSGRVSAIPDAIKGIFNVVDQAVTDKDKSNEIKLSVLQAITGQGSTHWLQANAFFVAMLVNYGMVVALSLLGKPVTEWSLIIALAWLVGPLLNGLSRDTIGKIIELAKQHKEGEKK